MLHIINEQLGPIAIITLNHIDKHNAFNEALLNELDEAIVKANANPSVRVIVLKANGKHFSAGACLNQMQVIAQQSEADNLADANKLANVLLSVYLSQKPTVAMVHGLAMGGGAGLVAACDIAIAATSAKFCFSEVKLGLIPAVISPYVIKAMGERASQALFISAEMVSAQRAYELKLVHHCVNDDSLNEFTMNYAKQIAQWAPQAISDCKTLVKQVASKAIDSALASETAAILAKKRVCTEAKIGIASFLQHKTPDWN